MIIRALDGPRTLRKNTFGVRFDIYFFKKAQRLTGMDLKGEIPVSISILVIIRAPYRPRTPRKNMNNPFWVKFDILFFKKAQSPTGMDL